MFFFFQAEDGIRDIGVTGVQTCALPIWRGPAEHRAGGAPRHRGPGPAALAGAADRAVVLPRPGGRRARPVLRRGPGGPGVAAAAISEEHTSELQSRQYLVCPTLLEKNIPRHSSLAI